MKQNTFTLNLGGKVSRYLTWFYGWGLWKAHGTEGTREKEKVDARTGWPVLVFGRIIVIYSSL
jgi:hypothetical protein